MSNLIELSDDELDIVSGGRHSGQLSHNGSHGFSPVIQINNDITLQFGLALNILSPGAIASVGNSSSSQQWNFVL
jgi:hypothetical protein